MKLASFAAAVAALALSSPALSAEAATTVSTEKQAKKADGEKKVCRILRTTGSRMGDRVCMTRDQWEKVDEEARN